MNRKLVATLMITAASASAYADNTTGSIILSGSIPPSTAISVQGQNNYNSLDLGNTVTDLVVANVRETNNTASGYTVSMASQNSGKLKNGNLGQISYTAKYDGRSVTLSNNPVQVTATGSTNNVVNIVKKLSISYTGVNSADLMQGNYIDTITFTIAAN